MEVAVKEKQQSPQILRKANSEHSTTAKQGGGSRNMLDAMREFKVEFGPSAKDIMSFTNQLTVMVRAGISLQDSLQSIAEQEKNDKFKTVITDLKNQIESGQSFSQALGKYPEVFSNIYINL